MSFEVIPTIDIRGGRCVRLFQGDFDQETVFADDPVTVAERWQACGAARLHVVDLDGAAEGNPVNTEIIHGIVRAVSVPIQVGGGLRSLESVERLLGFGVDRVVLGTAAVEDPGLVEEGARRYGDRVVVGIDARDGMAAIHGWKTTRQVSALDLVARMGRLGIGRVVYTDIARDGAMTGPNFAALETLLAASPAKVIASGGVSSVEHLLRLAELPLDGAIVGRALFTGAVDLREAIEAIASASIRDGA